MSADAPVNTREWWDGYFGGNWDANDGGGQTRHFMERLVAALPPAIRADLDRPGREILDWGCAQGQGVPVLQRAAPAARVAGLDCSDVALAVARRLFPDHEWIYHPDGAIPRPFDAIVCSNTLEHFVYPLDPLRRLIAAARRLVVVLVPYLEYPLCEYHPAQFRDESFPDRVGPAVRVASRVVEVERRHWPGSQLLVVYAREEVAAEITGAGSPVADEPTVRAAREADRAADRERADRLAARHDAVCHALGELAQKHRLPSPGIDGKYTELLAWIDALLSAGADARAELARHTGSRTGRLLARLRRWKHWMKANTLGRLGAR